MLEPLFNAAFKNTTMARRVATQASREVGATGASAANRLAAGTRVAAREGAIAAPVIAAAGAVDQLSAAERAVLKHPTANNHVTFHLAPEDAQAALLDSIRTAKSSFYIETFIWHNDASGNEVIQALADRVAQAKAKGETFDARVLIDWFGLHQGTGGSGDPLIVDKLRQAGVNVIEFAPGYISDGKLIPLTHRKLYIKDGASFMSGGRNIGDEYLKPTFVDPKGQSVTSWHDLLYTVEGNETGRVIDQFFKNWKRAGGKPPAVKPVIVPATGSARIQSFVTDPITGKHGLQAAQLDLIAHTKNEIFVAYPYFSDKQLVGALIEAKRKNPALAIKVLLPANREVTSEGGIYSALNRQSAREMMAVGIEVRMFSGGVVKGQTVDRFSHFKAMMFDRKVLSIGSANGDARTFHNNHELINVIADDATAKDFTNQVAAPDWASAKPLTEADLAQDSVWTRVKTKALEAIDFLF